MIAPPARAALGRLLEAAGLEAEGEPELSGLDGGANNRVYLVTVGSERAVLKVYFPDGRPRLEAEFSFLTFARACGIDAVPMPLARDDTAGMALYAMAAGRRMSPADVDTRAIDEAASLFALLNSHREEAGREALPKAAEACFSISEHLQRVDARVTSLTGLEAVDEIDEMAERVIAEQLQPRWQATRESVLASTSRAALEQPLAPGQRCVSPSDLGFHNALIDDDGRITFIDFEYAGWDDPAKLVCDFFCQVELPVPREEQPRFERIALAPFVEAKRIVDRSLLLAPVYQVKWACIVLNDFLGQGRARRSYALGSEETRQRRLAQVAKARNALDRMK